MLIERDDHSSSVCLLPNETELASDFPFIHKVVELAHTRDIGEYIGGLVLYAREITSLPLRQTALLNTKAIAIGFGVPYKTVKKELALLRRKFPQDCYLEYGQNLFEPEYKEKEYVYSDQTQGLLLLHLIIRGHRGEENQLLDLAKKRWIEIEKEVDSLFDLPTVPEFAKSKGYGSSTVHRVLLENLGKNWKTQCAPKIIHSSVISTLPPWIQKEITPLLPPKRREPQEKRSLQPKVVFESRDITDLRLQAKARQVARKLFDQGNFNLAEFAQKMRIDMKSARKILFKTNALGLFHPLSLRVAQEWREELKAKKGRVTLNDFANGLGISENEATQILMKLLSYSLHRI